MKKSTLKEPTPIEVVAHTHKGFIAPDLVILKRKKYSVTNIVKRYRLSKWREKIILEVVTSKRLELEFNHRYKTWQLLHLEPDPF